MDPFEARSIGQVAYSCGRKWLQAGGELPRERCLAEFRRITLPRTPLNKTCNVGHLGDVYESDKSYDVAYRRVLTGESQPDLHPARRRIR
jgi:hypothetical protein